LPKVNSDSNVDEKLISSSSDSGSDEDFSVTFTSVAENESEDTVVLTSEAIAQKWMTDALNSFKNSNRQYSVSLNEKNAGGLSDRLTIERIKELASNAQSDLNKILEINKIVRQVVNEDDIIGMVYEAIVSNLNSNIRYSFEALPENPNKKKKEKAEKLIKQFHKETRIDRFLTNAIPTVYIEGNHISYLREKNGHYTIDAYPLGVAIVSDYSVNGIPYVLIDIRELTARLQKTIIKGKRNKSLFFDNMAQEIKANYPNEIYQAFINKERYAKLEIRHTGVNRICNSNRKYGLTPVFKALKPNLMLDAFDSADLINTKAKAKKIIHQILRKETMGQTYEKKGLEEMSYAHMQLIEAWRNPTVVYTSIPSVEKIQYVEPKVDTTDTEKVKDYRTRVTSALGISFLNIDGNSTASVSNISIKQLFKTIDKIADEFEDTLSRWYSIVLEDNNIPQEYCPTPHILDAEMIELEMRKSLAEVLYSKFNCSYETAYDLLGYDVNDEVEKRKREDELGYTQILAPHPTSYNSSGDSSSEDNQGGHPSGKANGDNEVNDKRVESYKNNSEEAL